MSDRIFAILIHDQPGPLDSLKLVLRDLSVETFSVTSLEEARRLIPQTSPHILFTATSVADGSWTDVIYLAEQADIPLNVIVVSANKDIKLYITALERGAYDFVLPPFEPLALDIVVRSAGENVRHRRRALARLAVAS
ncbi:MAG TPA: response regulator [Terriglobia bacterium]|nr:response regulator [Terriglobia bacterium]